MEDIFQWWRPVRFYPYTSAVRTRVYAENMTQDPDRSMYFEKTEQELIALFNAHGIPARTDNKIVFEFEKDGKSIFVGFYDWTFSIGLSVFSDKWIVPIGKTEVKS